MQKDLTKGSVFQNIVFFSLPYLLSYFLQTLYGLADLYIVGQFNGASIISAVSIGSQVMHMLTVIIVGLAMGSTVMISQAVGAKRPERAAKSIGNTISLFVVVSLVLTAVLIFLTGPIVSIMSTPAEAVEQTKMYLLICFAGIPFITAYNIISAVFRGMGDSKSPMYFIATACVLNILLDYILIGFFGMGAAGAAWGTVAAQTASVILALITIKIKELGITVTRQDLIPDGQTTGNILKVGVPVALQDGFIQISFIVITVIANQRGVSVAAGVGIVEKIISVLFLVPSSMLSSISALAAQNIGAGQHGRARRTFQYGLVITVLFGAFFMTLCQFFSIPMLGLFTNDAVVVRFGSQYLRTYSIDCVLAGIHFCFSGYFCAYGLSVVSFIHNFLSIILLRIPGSYLASKFYPDTLAPMGLAAPAGSLLSDVICVAVFIWLGKKYLSDTAKKEVDRFSRKC